MTDASSRRRRVVAISAPVPHHLFHGNLPGVGALVDDELYKVRILNRFSILRIIHVFQPRLAHIKNIFQAAFDARAF